MVATEVEEKGEGSVMVFLAEPWPLLVPSPAAGSIMPSNSSLLQLLVLEEVVPKAVVGPSWAYIMSTAIDHTHTEKIFLCKKNSPNILRPPTQICYHNMNHDYIIIYNFY